MVVDGVVVPPGAWTRRHAAALVKLLALRPHRRLHREQVLDLVWPDDAVDAAAAKLHKAAHYARKATGRADTIVLGGELVQLFPDAESPSMRSSSRRCAIEVAATGDRDAWPPGRWSCTAASCCPTTPTRSGPRCDGSASGAAT